MKEQLQEILEGGIENSQLLDNLIDLPAFEPHNKEGEVQKQSLRNLLMSYNNNN